MSKVAVAFLLVCLPLFSAGVAEERPNFTGTWKQDPQRSTPVDSSSGVSLNRIVHQDPELKVDAQTTDGGWPFIGGVFNHQAYRTDGEEQQGTSRWTTVSWHGPALVLMTVQKKDSRITFTRETWTLSEDGKALTKSRRTVSPEGVTEQTLVFEKQ